MSDGNADSPLQRARAGDRDALHQLLCDHFDRLQQHIEFRVGTDSPDLSSEDILQDTFVHAVLSINQCQATDEATFFSWLKAVAQNRLRDALKKSATLKRGGDRQQIHAVKLAGASSLRPLIELLSQSSDTPSRNTPSGDAASYEAVKAIQIALCGLPEDQRDAIVLKHIQGLELDAVAKQLGKTPPAVRGLIHRGKEALREAMGNSSRWFTKK